MPPDPRRPLLVSESRRLHPGCATDARRRRPLAPVSGDASAAGDSAPAAIASRPMREVRIKDTLSGELSRSSRASRPRGRDLRLRADRLLRGSTSATPAPTSSSCCCARFLAHEGYEPRLVINVTDVNDKIYDAARASGRGLGRAARREMTDAYVEDTDRLGLGRPDAEPLATETIGRDRRPDRGAGRVRPRLRVGRRRLLPRPQLRRLRQALQPRPRRDGPGRGGRQRRR